MTNDRATIASGGETTGLPTPPTELRLTEEEEQLQVGKRQVEAGQVHLHTTVHTEHQEVPVELAEDNVEVERVDVADGAVAPDAFQEREIDVPLQREEAVVGKSTRATEEIRINKNVDVEQRTVGADVRRSEVQVDDAAVDDYVITPEEREQR